MVRTMVEKKMKKALLSFAEKEQKTPDRIAIGIHTKPTEDSPELLPKYFYTVDGQTVKENGEVKELRFVQDILGKKMDMMGTSYHADIFFAKFFKERSERHRVTPQQLLVLITCIDEEAKNLALGIYNKSEQIQSVELHEIFGED